MARKKKKEVKVQKIKVNSGGSKGGVRDAPPGGPNSFNFMQFLRNLAKSYVGAPRGVGAPSSGKSWIRHWLREKRRTFNKKTVKSIENRNV